MITPSQPYKCDDDLCCFAANVPGAGDEEQESTRLKAESGGSGSCDGDEPDTEESRSLMSCPLCSEKFPSQDRLESHAMSVHSVNSEGLQRLQSLINGSHWLNKKSEGIKLNHFVPNHLIGYRYYYYHYCLMSLESNCCRIRFCSNMLKNNNFLKYNLGMFLINLNQSSNYQFSKNKV